MLVLTRKKDEQIRIGEDIIITVIRVKGKSVRLGIQAPRTEPVLRGELEFRDPSELEFRNPSDSSSEPSPDAPPCLGLRMGTAGAARRVGRRPLRDYLKAAVGAPGE